MHSWFKICARCCSPSQSLLYYLYPLRVVCDGIVSTLFVVIDFVTTHRTRFRSPSSHHISQRGLAYIFLIPKPQQSHMASRYVAVTFAEKPRYVGRGALALSATKLTNSIDRLSVSKLVERRIIRAWKKMTRKPQRKSILMEDFVMLNARRRSMLPFA